MIFTMTGFSGAELSATASLTRPAAPTGQQLWAESGVAASGWDISPLRPHRKSSSRNLIVHPYDHGTRTAQGITWTDMGDGTIRANGTATALSSFYAAYMGVERGELLLGPGVYTLSGCPAGGGSGKYQLGLCLSRDDWASSEWKMCFGSPVTFSVDSRCRARVTCQVSAGTSVSNIYFKPQLERGRSAGSFVKGSAQGQLWFISGKREDTALSPLPDGSITLCPEACRQYINGEWVLKKGAVYTGAAWKELFYSTISVSYPAGAVCVCSKGELSFTAPDTSGSCVFALPEAGEWTLRAARGSRSAETVVTVSAGGQNLSAALSFELYLVRSGQRVAEYLPHVVNGVYDYGSDGSLILTGSESAQIYSVMTPQVDLTDYSTMYIRASGTTYFYFGVGSDSALSREVKSTVHNAAGGELLSLSVADLSGKYYAAAHGRLYGASTVIYDWWLE